MRVFARQVIGLAAMAVSLPGLAQELTLKFQHIWNPAGQFPAVMGLELWGMDPQSKAIWFGILVLMTVGIGLVAPPIGLNVYVVNSIAKDVSMSETYKGVLPFLVSDFLRVGVLLFFPVLSLGLVRLLFK